MRDLFLKFFKVLFSDIRSLVVIALIATSILLQYVEPKTENNGEYSSPQLVNVAQCIGWHEAASPVSQGAYILNGDHVESLSLSIDGTPASLQALASRKQQLSKGHFVPVVAEGKGADSLAAIVSARSKPKTATGLAADSCHPPSSDWWFTGIKTLAGYSARLLLANPDSADAIIAVEAFDEEGEVQVGQFRRVVVPASKLKLVDLTQAVPGKAAVTIHLQAIEGRISPSLQVESLKGAVRFGRSYISPITAPTTSAVITGIRGASTGQQLVVMAPVADAIITVKVHRRDGSFTMAGADSLLITKQQTRVLLLTDALSGGDAAIEIVSDQPILAAARSYITAQNGKDYEVQSAQLPLASKAVTIVPDGVAANYFGYYALKATTVIVTALKDGKPSWKQSFEIPAEEFNYFTIDPKQAIGTLLTFETSEPGVYLSHLMTSVVSKKGQSASLGLYDPSSQLVPGVRLHLLVS